MTFPNKKYVSFDDKETRKLAETNPKDFLLAYPQGVIIDEAQKVPDIFDALKFAVDNSEYAPGKYILTGSSQFKLKENMTDSLAGRIGVIKLLSFLQFLYARVLYQIITYKLLNSNILYFLPTNIVQT